MLSIIFIQNFCNSSSCFPIASFKIFKTQQFSSIKIGFYFLFSHLIFCLCLSIQQIEQEIQEDPMLQQKQIQLNYCFQQQAQGQFKCNTINSFECCPFSQQLYFSCSDMEDCQKNHNLDEQMTLTHKVSDLEVGDRKKGYKMQEQWENAEYQDVSGFSNFKKKKNKLIIDNNDKKTVTTDQIRGSDPFFDQANLLLRKNLKRKNTFNHQETETSTTSILVSSLDLEQMNITDNQDDILLRVKNHDDENQYECSTLNSDILKPPQIIDFVLEDNMGRQMGQEIEQLVFGDEEMEMEDDEMSDEMSEQIDLTKAIGKYRQDNFPTLEPMSSMDWDEELEDF